MVKWVHDDNLRAGEYFFLHDDVPDAMSKAMRVQMLPRNRFERWYHVFHWPSFLLGVAIGALGLYVTLTLVLIGRNGW